MSVLYLQYTHYVYIQFFIVIKFEKSDKKKRTNTPNKIIPKMVIWANYVLSPVHWVKIKQSSILSVM